MSTSPPAPSVPVSLSPREELAALVEIVDKLVLRANALTRMAREVQTKLPNILDRLNAEAAADHVWVRAVAKDPAVVEAEHASELNGSRGWWVVYVGREPGLYTTVEAANIQINGCPGQQCRRKGSKAEALLFYRQKWDDGEVRKWVEIVDSDDSSDSDK
ncbi:hypothetical protein B0H19DRAFT_1071442 [Mycena capillaripes]|nr:hypothetical protein B0H19DRAFT_1071442 [Mycena capillaripes]